MAEPSSIEGARVEEAIVDRKVEVGQGLVYPIQLQIDPTAGIEDPGQFNSRFPNEADGLPLLLGEGFAGGARFLPGFADQVERGVAERGEGLGC